YMIFGPGLRHHVGHSGVARQYQIRGDGQALWHITAAHRCDENFNCPEPHGRWIVHGPELHLMTDRQFIGEAEVAAGLWWYRACREPGDEEGFHRPHALQATVAPDAADVAVGFGQRSGGRIVPTLTLPPGPLDTDNFDLRIARKHFQRGREPDLRRLRRARA